MPNIWFKIVGSCVYENIGSCQNWENFAVSNDFCTIGSETYCWKTVKYQLKITSEELRHQEVDRKSQQECESMLMIGEVGVVVVNNIMCDKDRTKLPMKAYFAKQNLNGQKSGERTLSLFLTIANIKIGAELFLTETKAETGDRGTREINNDVAKSIYAKHLVWIGIKPSSISFQEAELKGAELESFSVLGSFGVILEEDMIFTLAYGKAVKGGALLLILLKQKFPNSKITIEDYLGYGLTRYEKNLSDEKSAKVKMKSKEGKIFLIQLENKIKINSNASAKILLPESKLQDRAKCVRCEGIPSGLIPGVLPAGILSEKLPDICRVRNVNNPKNIQDFPVEILKWNTCKENLSDLDNDLICLTNSDCAEFNGGEPLICGGRSETLTITTFCNRYCVQLCTDYYKIRENEMQLQNFCV
uniref:Uncharacterized protein n=1 Tax=Glossina palpalis gambiensis TaxID=67801 RepID=A0A1B0AU67_9MUSC